MTAAAPRAVDVHALPAMLTALRLPSIQRHWTMLAERADAEGWPASRFLAALAEVELGLSRCPPHPAPSAAVRTSRRQDAGNARLQGAFRREPCARIEALAAGDWVETGANLIAIGNSGAGKSHLLCAIGHALVEAGKRVLYTPTTDIVQRLQAARRDLILEAALAKLDKFDLFAGRSFHWKAR
jgi:DNA replication protein DnaC